MFVSVATRKLAFKQKFDNFVYQKVGMPGVKHNFWAILLQCVKEFSFI